MAYTQQQLLQFMDDWRDDIPILCKPNPIVYLDTAASALKPQPVIDALLSYYNEFPVNIHRGTYRLSVLASEAFEQARDSIANFFHANEDYTIIFTSGMTEASNMLANAHRYILSSTDKITVTLLDHHSMLLPWREVSKDIQANLIMVPLVPSGCIDLKLLKESIAKSRILAINGMSNVTGYYPPLQEIQKSCELSGCKMIVDAAQLAMHAPINLSKTPYDAVLCSAHKLGGPTGIGALCIKKTWLEELNLYKTGGGTVEKVTIEDTVYLDVPERFEAGTPNIAGAIGFAKAVEYLQDKGWGNILAYEKILRDHLLNVIQSFEGVRILGDIDIADTATISFVSDKWHPQDISFVLEQHNVCIRTGKLCAEPLLQFFECSQVARVSAFCYNRIEDIAYFGQQLNALNEIHK